MTQWYLILTVTVALCLELRSRAVHVDSKLRQQPLVDNNFVYDTLVLTANTNQTTELDNQSTSFQPPIDTRCIQSSSRLFAQMKVLTLSSNVLVQRMHLQGLTGVKHVEMQLERDTFDTHISARNTAACTPLYFLQLVLDGYSLFTWSNDERAKLVKVTVLNGNAAMFRHRLRGCYCQLIGSENFR